MEKINYSLKSPDELIFSDKGKVLYGCSQELYKDEWQRRAGCGPTSAANHVIYMINTDRFRFKRECESSKSKIEQNEKILIDRVKNTDDCLAVMEELWNYVTPTMLGVNKSSIFKNGIEKFFEDNGRKAFVETLEIPSRFINHDGMESIIHFIVSSIKNDCPVSFLNLINRNFAKPDNWHWVTIVEIQVLGDYDDAVITIFDGYEKYKVNISEWFSSRIMGGAFLKFGLED